VDEGARRYNELSEAEREQLAADGEREYARVREQIAQEQRRGPRQDDEEEGGGSILRPSW
jgi:hypothetical protein